MPPAPGPESRFYSSRPTIATRARTAARSYCLLVRILLTPGTLEVRLARWQKILGLMRNITIPRDHIDDVQVVDDPVREAMATGLKAGLRIPWLYYACRTIKLDQAFVVRRNVPGLSISVHDHGALTRVLLSTPEARLLAQRLADGS